MRVAAIAELITGHHVATSPADAVQQWFNAGGGISYYDFPVDVYINVRFTYFYISPTKI